MALLRQRAVVVTYSEVWEGETFVKSRIQVEAGAAAGNAAETAPAARSIFDPDAEPPELADQTAEEEEAAAKEAQLKLKAFSLVTAPVWLYNQPKRSDIYGFFRRYLQNFCP